MTNSKNGLNTTKPKLQAYSQRELRQIAASIEEFRKTSQEEYTWTDADGKLHAESRYIHHGSKANEWLHVIAKDLYIQAARPRRKGELKVIGTT